MGKRLEVLSALDGAKTSWYYFTTVVIAGMGFFTDAYNLLCITTVTKLLGRIYYYRKGSSEPGTLPGNVNAAVTGVALIGTLVGQLFFGWLGDKLGRKKVCGLTLMLMATSSIGSGLSFGRTSGSVMTTLCFFRFWLGFGVGGDYPLSATIMSEHANKKTRGAFIAAVFAMQGFGILAGGAVAYFVSSAFMQYEKGNQGPLPVKKADYVWRIILMLGAVPAALTLYWRMKMPETSRYTALVEKNAEQAAADMSKVLKGFGILAGGAVAYFVSSAFMQYEKGNQGPLPVKKADYVWRIILMLEAVPAALTFYWRMKMPETGRYTALVEKNAEQVAADMSKVLKVDIAEGNIGKVEEPHYHLFSIEFLRRHGLHLLGTSSTWFLLDVAFYSQSLFQNDMFSNVGWIRSADKLKAIEEVNEIASAQAKIAMLSIVPGYWFTVFLIDHIGRFAVQLIGFSFMTIFMFALSIPYDHWKKSDCQGFVALYALTFFFANFGPNSTTFIVPAELFPARLRSTCHGISAAAGKAGAIVGNFGIGNLALKREKQQKLALIILAVTNALGFLFTFLVPETNGEFFENISGENDGGGEEKG